VADGAEDGLNKELLSERLRITRATQRLNVLLLRYFIRVGIPNLIIDTQTFSLISVLENPPTLFHFYFIISPGTSQALKTL
jgi:hypothetical protein